VNTFNERFIETWNKLSRSKEYRDAFVVSMFRRMLPFQIKALRKGRGWSQERLAEEANLTQGVVSRAEDPDYGNLTVNTLCRIASGFDVAFLAKFVPFSELNQSFVKLSEDSVQVPSFEEENEILIDTLGSVLSQECEDAIQGNEQVERPGLLSCHRRDSALAAAAN
jgi:transcriptional regulator with XRE-family HTH domain